MDRTEISHDFRKTAMTTKTEHEEYMTREDLVLSPELSDRINACRQRLRNREQMLTGSEIEQVYKLLGDCATELSKVAHERRQDQIKMGSVLRLLQEMSGTKSE
jgi:hypothetical protein